MFVCVCVCAYVCVTSQERYLGRHLRSIVENGIGPSLKSARVKELLASIDQMKTLTI